LSWTRRKSYKFSIPPKYQRLEAGDVIDVELRSDGSATQLQIKRLNQSPSGVIEVEAIAYDGSIFELGYTSPAAKTSTATATQGTAINLGQSNVYAINSVTDITGGTTYALGTDYTVNTSTGTITPIIGGGISNGSEVVVNWQGEAEETPAPDLTPIPTTLQAIDIVKPTANDSTGIYLFADGDAPWQSATLWESSDGTNYTSAGPIYRGIFGTANTTLPDGSGVDMVSTLSVTVTDTMTLPASGRLLVGDEILDYASAVLASSTPTSKTYTLSEFNRALRDTDGTGHGSSEAVYLLSGYKFVSPIDSADIGTTRYFKAVSPGQSLTDVTAISIVIVGNSLLDEGVFFANIAGQPKDNTALGNILTRSLRYTATTSDFTIPAIGGTVTVDVVDSDYIQPTMPLFISIEGYGFCQLVCTAKSGLTLTLTREAEGLFSQSVFEAPALVFPMTESVKIYRFGEVSDAITVPWENITGAARDNDDLDAELTAIDNALDDKFDNPTGTTSQYLRGDGTPEDFPEFASTKTKNIESISATKTLTLSADYFQFLTPTVASVIVKLPDVISTDYFECEVVNLSTSNAIAVQEFNGTAIVILENDDDLARSIYVFWDGSTWQVWIRGYY